RSDPEGRTARLRESAHVRSRPSRTHRAGRADREMRERERPRDGEVRRRLANNLVRPCVNIVGLGRVSDTLIVKSKELADTYGAIMNMNQYAFPEKVVRYRQRKGRTATTLMEWPCYLMSSTIHVYMSRGPLHNI